SRRSSMTGWRICANIAACAAATELRPTAPAAPRRRSGAQRLRWRHWRPGIPSGMSGPSFRAQLVKARALLGCEHRANLLARGVHDLAQGAAWSLPETVDLHAALREDAVDVRTLERVESELLAEMMIAGGAEGRASVHHPAAHVLHSQARRPGLRDHPRG